MSQILGNVLFEGVERQIWWTENQRRPFEYRGGKFWVNRQTAENQMVFYEYYDEFCKTEISRIVDRQIKLLRTKIIEVDVEYTQVGNSENIWKVEKFSVDSYLKALGFSQKIDYQIGIYEKEWGINQISPKNKRFTLLFNLNLIKFDNGKHIEYVVAHELAHIFHRNHGPEFQRALQNLFPRKSESENFFERGLNSLIGGQNKVPLAFVIGLLAIVLIYWLYTFLQIGLPALFPTNAKF